MTGGVPGLVEFPDREALMAAAAEALAAALAGACAERGEGCAALSGGATPERAYALLARKPLNWPRIVFLQVDERRLPPSHEASNEGMLRRALAPALAAGARLEPIADPDAERLYGEARIDIALLGMGADAHTASWFAGAAGLAAALDPSNTHATAAVHAPGAAGAADRLTLTRAALARAAKALLLIAGRDKLDALVRALGRPPTEAPVTALFDGVGPSPAVYWAP